MLGIDTRAARAAWTVLLVASAAAAVYLIRRTILIFIAALLVAYLLAPLVKVVDRITPRKMPRVLSLAVVYLLLLAIIGFASVVVVSQIVQQAGQLAGNVPDWLRNSGALGGLPVPSWLEAWKAKVIEIVRGELAANVRQVLPLIGQVGEGVLFVLSNLGFLVLVPILSFLFLKDAESIRGWILRRVAGTGRHAWLEDVLSDVNILLGQFIRALVILAVATLVFYNLFLGAIRLPYAALLAGLAGALEFIPMVGPFVAGIAIILVALLSGHAKLALWIIVFLLGYRLFQDYVLQPFLMSKGVQLHPLWVIFGVLAGEQIGGVAGMFLSIPVLAILRVAYVRIRKAQQPVSVAP